jgi:hypothetical protein
MARIAVQKVHTSNRLLALLSQTVLHERFHNLLELYVVYEDGSEQLDFPGFQAGFRPKAQA